MGKKQLGLLELANKIILEKLGGWELGLSSNVSDYGMVGDEEVLFELTVSVTMDQGSEPRYMWQFDKYRGKVLISSAFYNTNDDYAPDVPHTTRPLTENDVDKIGELLSYL